MSTAACSGSPPRIEVRDAWARETKGTSTAVYLTLANTGGADDRLTGASSRAGTASLHVTKSADGIARMRPVPDKEGLTVPAGGELALRPGGAHIMLSGLKQPARSGDAIPLTLTFAQSGTRPIEVPVRLAEETSHGH